MQKLSISELKWIVSVLYNERIEAENALDNINLDSTAKAFLKLKVDNYKDVETKIKNVVNSNDKRIEIVRG